METKNTFRNQKNMVVEKANEMEATFKKYMKLLPVFFEIDGKLMRKAFTHVVSPILKPEIKKLVNIARNELPSGNGYVSGPQEKVWEEIGEVYERINGFLDELIDREVEDFTLIGEVLEKEKFVIQILLKELE